MSVRLHLVAEEARLREALRTIFDRETDLVVVAEADSLESARAGVAASSPDVVVVDADLRSGDPYELVRAVQPTRARVLLLAAQPGLDRVQAGLLAGAAGLIGKVQPPRELVIAVRRVAAGGCYLDPSLARRVAIPPAVRATLTAREQLVYEQLVAGLSTEAIARDLAISPRTVRGARTRIQRKLGVATPAELLCLAMAPPVC